MKALVLLLFLSACGQMQDNTTTGDKLIITGGILTYTAFLLMAAR